MKRSRSPVQIYGALAAALGIAAVKFAAAAVSGSSAMLSEGIHSVIDSGNEVLLLAGLRRSRQTRAWIADGIASILIGVLLAAVATVLIAEGRRLLIGESARAETVKHIRQLARNDPAVADVTGPLTMHLGPDAILVNLGLRFREGTSPAEGAAAAERIDRAIRHAHPRVSHVFIDSRGLPGAGRDVPP